MTEQIDPQLIVREENSELGVSAKVYSLLTLPLELVSDAAQSFRFTVIHAGIDLPSVKNGFIHYATLLMATYIYCFAGAFMFRIVEGWHELRAKCDIQRERYSLIEDFWNQSAYMDYDEWKNFATGKLKSFENSVHKAHDEGVTSYSGTKVWTFDGALVYSITVFTTIGYGHIIPSTTAGRALTMVYATFGIPLLLMVLADFGKLFTRGIKFLYSLVHRFYHTESCKKFRRTGVIQATVKAIKRQSKDEQITYTSSTTKNINNCNYDCREEMEINQENQKYQIDDEFDLPVGVAVTLLVGYIMLGALMFNQWEVNWSFFEAFYFVFISMSTIGFGDLVPEHPIFMMGTFVYLLFGLALTSMCINVIQEWLTKTFKKASSKLSAHMGIEARERPSTAMTSQIQEVNSKVNDFQTSLLKTKGE